MEKILSRHGEDVIDDMDPQLEIKV